jgi:hypothetical protein
MYIGFKAVPDVAAFFFGQVYISPADPCGWLECGGACKTLDRADNDGNYQVLSLDPVHTPAQYMYEDK